jgi:DNA-binding MarR family transcriptional regulator
MDAAGFRQRVRALVRALGVLDESRTPCGVDVSVREAYALDALARAEAARRPFSQSDLQVALGVDKSNVTRLVQQLVEDGRVEQRASDGDGRVRLLHLTTKGRRVARNVEDESLKRFAAVVARIPGGEREAVFHALEVFRAALESNREETDS